jgi:DNA-binding response OmpR family regulator
VHVNILIVDDSRLLRLSNERVLAKAGHHVIAAQDGEEGLRLALEQKPDLVVLDLMLPKLSGPEVLRGLRQNSDTATTPVLVLSGLPQCNENKLISEGATAYFQKSGLLVENGPSLLLEAVERLLAKTALAKAATTGH